MNAMPLFKLELSISLLIFLFSFSPLIFSQTAQFEFYSNADHFSSNHVWYMTQDQEGFMWMIGNQVDRYNGFDFENINEGSYKDFFFDGEFIGTPNYIIQYDRDYIFIRKIQTGRLDSILLYDFIPRTEEKIKIFAYELNNENLLIASKDPKTGIVTFWEEQKGILKKRFSTSDVWFSRHQFFVQFDNGDFFFPNATKNQMIRCDSLGNILQKIPLPKIAGEYLRFKKGKGNKLIILNQNELFFWKIGDHQFQPHSANILIEKYCKGSINDFVETSEGDLWICGNDRQIIFYKKSTHEIFQFQETIEELIPHQTNFLNLMMDEMENLWISSVLGVLKVTPQYSLFDTYFTKSTEDCGGLCSFRGIVGNDKNKVYASFYSSLFEIDLETKTTSKPFENFTNTPFGLGFKDDLLILNDGRIINVKTEEFVEIKPIREHQIDLGIVIQDKKGNIWLGSNKEIFFLNERETPYRWEVVAELPKIGGTFVLHFGRKSNTIWVTHGYKIFQFYPDSKELIKRHEFNRKIQIFSICEDMEGKVWVGHSKGLLGFDPLSKKTKNYTVKDGLPNNVVCGILSEGDSCVWVSTNSGIARFQKQNETFLNFFKEDGLSHNEFNRYSTYQAEDGQLFFGGMQGVNAFYPEEVMKKYRKSQYGKVVLSAFKRTDDRQNQFVENFINVNKKELEVFHWNKSITFEYGFTDFRSGQKSQFSYLLEGYDKVWSIPSKVNFAKYSSLPSGDYTLKVKALDGKGYWSPNELSIPVKVYPPWWLTRGAYFTYCLILMGVLGLVFRLMQYRFALKNEIVFKQKEAERLQELDTFKSRLFTNLTHEFRTPLTVILGMARQISKNTSNFEIEDKTKNTLSSHVEIIEQNGQSLLKLVNQLLDLSKLESKAFRLNVQNDDVIPFLNYIISSYQSFADQEKIKLRFSTNLQQQRMDFDANLLQQVMTNLISNAIKFTPSGGSITVKVEKMEMLDEEFLQIRVQDTGIGIPFEKLPNIFDRFYQVDGSTTRVGEGTGIGLTHTKELLNLMEGEISVMSKENEGTTFFVKLPIGNDFVKEDQLHLKKNISPQGFIVQRKRINKVATEILKTDLPKLLLIEDNPDVVIYIKTCLAENYQVEVAYNGKEGINKALELIPDLIISDVMMPEKDGYEVCETLKNDEKTSHIPIVLLTAKADISSKITGLQRGADAYLSKPFHEEELEIRLQSLLEKQRKLVEYFSQKNKSDKGDLETIIPSSSTPISNEDLKVENAFIQKIDKILEENYSDKDFNLMLLCKKIGMSRSQLFRKMKALTGTSPSNYIRTFRLFKAKSLFESSDLNVSEVAWETGFSSLPHFSRIFQEEFQISPSDLIAKKFLS